MPTGALISLSQQLLPSGGELVQRAVRLAQGVLCTLYVAVALLGVLFMSPVVLLTAGPTLGVAAAGLLAGLYWYCEQRPPSRRTVTTTAAVAAAIVPFDEGTEVLQGLGTTIALTVLVLATLVGQYRVYVLSAPSPADRRSAGGTTSYAELLQVMPLETVFTEWRAQEQGRRSPLSGQRSPDLLHVRTVLLEEMQGRDPVGFGRWLDDGAVDPPELHVRGDRGLTA